MASSYPAAIYRRPVRWRCHRHKDEVFITIDDDGTIVAEGFPARLAGERWAYYDGHPNDGGTPLVWILDCDRRGADRFDPTVESELEALRSELVEGATPMGMDAPDLEFAASTLCPAAVVVDTASAQSNRSALEIGSHRRGIRPVAVSGALRHLRVGIATGVTRVRELAELGQLVVRERQRNRINQVEALEVCSYPAACGPPSRQASGECLCDEAGVPRFVERYGSRGQEEAPFVIVWSSLPRRLFSAADDAHVHTVAGDLEATGGSCFDSFETCVAGFVKVLSPSGATTYAAHKDTVHHAESARVLALSFSPNREALYVTSIRHEGDCSWDAEGIFISRIELATGAQQRVGVLIDIWEHSEVWWDGSSWVPEFVWLED